ncbi:MAG: hypothetical protein MJA27_12050 [Pseudanabaenales cyanobacterium]|nr:hypothetical protein [Pseudanabaenales cyanobacterium]
MRRTRSYIPTYIPKVGQFAPQIQPLPSFGVSNPDFSQQIASKYSGLKLGRFPLATLTLLQKASRGSHVFNITQILKNKVIYTFPSTTQLKLNLNVPFFWNIVVQRLLRGKRQNQPQPLSKNGLTLSPGNSIPITRTSPLQTHQPVSMGLKLQQRWLSQTGLLFQSQADLKAIPLSFQQKTLPPQEVKSKDDKKHGDAKAQEIERKFSISLASSRPHFFTFCFPKKPLFISPKISALSVSSKLEQFKQLRANVITFQTLLLQPLSLSTLSGGSILGFLSPRQPIKVISREKTTQMNQSTFIQFPSWEGLGVGLSEVSWLTQPPTPSQEEANASWDIYSQKSPKLLINNRNDLALLNLSQKQSVSPETSMLTRSVNMSRTISTFERQFNLVQRQQSIETKSILQSGEMALHSRDELSLEPHHIRTNRLNQQRLQINQPSSISEELVLARQINNAAAINQSRQGDYAFSKATAMEFAQSKSMATPIWSNQASQVDRKKGWEKQRQTNFDLPNIEVNRLADQVYQMIERKIKIERHRRGLL